MRDDDEQSSVRKPDRVEEDARDGRPDEGTEGKDGSPQTGNESVSVDGVRKSVKDGGFVGVGESGDHLGSESDPCS